jgi:two-component system OmpR family response regulator
LPFNPHFSVLCVDDDPDACAMLSELLKLSRIHCQCADSAAEAWRMISAERFDLYLLDGWLPDLDGFEFCRQIRAIDSNTPILFYSGAAYDSDRQKGIAAGANAYVVKPEIEDLVETMSRLVAEASHAADKTHSPVLRNLIEANRRAALFAPRTLRAGSF